MSPAEPRYGKRKESLVRIVLIVLLVLLCLGGLPQTGWHEMGYAPSGFLGLLLVLVLVMTLLGMM